MWLSQYFPIYKRILLHRWFLDILKNCTLRMDADKYQYTIRKEVWIVHTPRYRKITAVYVKYDIKKENKWRNMMMMLHLCVITTKLSVVRAYRKKKGSCIASIRCIYVLEAKWLLICSLFTNFFDILIQRPEPGNLNIFNRLLTSHWN